MSFDNKCGKISRRNFLKNSAMASASLSMLPMFGVPRAQAATGIAPLRLILVWTPFQASEVFFHPQVSSTNTSMASAGSNFYLNYTNSILAPLAPFQSDLIIFRGLKYGQNPTGSAIVGTHTSFQTTFTGATANVSAGTTSGTSIDQYLYGRLAKGMVSPFFAAPFGYDFAGSAHSDDMIYNKGIAALQMANPMDVYKAMFANFKPSTGGASASTNRRVQVLQLVQRHLASLSSQLPSSSTSYTILQSHLAAAQALSSQISSSSSSGMSCTPLASSSVIDDPWADNGEAFVAMPNMANDIASFNKVIVSALACDITRFGAIKFFNGGDPFNNMVSQIPGLAGWNPNSSFHDLVSHKCENSATNTADIQMASYKRYWMTHVANLLTALKAVPDPYAPTQTLYDNTVVLIGQEGAVHSRDDVHNAVGAKDDWPFIIAGGCGGNFKMGQLIMAGAGSSTTPTVAHNALLTNVVNTFETNQQQFNPAYVPNILTQYGDYSFSVSPTTWLK